MSWLHKNRDICWRHQMETFSALPVVCAGNSPVSGEFPHKGQWCGALMFSLIYGWINDWVNSREAGDLRRQRGHYDVIVMICSCGINLINSQQKRPYVQKWHPTQSTSVLKWTLSMRNQSCHRILLRTNHLLFWFLTHHFLVKLCLATRSTVRLRWFSKLAI